MRVLILGGAGMLGHKLWLVCSTRFETYVTVRGRPESYFSLGLFDPGHLVGGVSAENLESVDHALDGVKPNVVVNCIGIVKQAPNARDPIASITVNALLPHLLARACGERSIRLIHISTDCVFSGDRGSYKEDDPSDAQDLYGRTKFLGEVDGEHCLTIRTSMIGRELRTPHGLVEWFLSEKGGVVRGYKRAVFSGFTTLALSRIIAEVAIPQIELHGICHVASSPMSKFQLLSLINEVYSLGITIEPDTTVVCDRSLNGELFEKSTEFMPPPWPSMIEEMRRDPTPYDTLRRLHAD